MTLPRFAARRDATEPDIVDALESLGFHVERLSEPGIPDLLLSRRHRWYVAECKTPRGRATKSQNAFRLRALGPVAVFREVGDVLAWEREL